MRNTFSNFRKNDANGQNPRFLQEPRFAKSFAGIIKIIFSWFNSLASHALLTPNSLASHSQLTCISIASHTHLRRLSNRPKNKQSDRNSSHSQRPRAAAAAAGSNRNRSRSQRPRAGTSAQRPRAAAADSSRQPPEKQQQQSNSRTATAAVASEHNNYSSSAAINQNSDTTHSQLGSSRQHTEAQQRQQRWKVKGTMAVQNVKSRRCNSSSCRTTAR